MTGRGPSPTIDKVIRQDKDGNPVTLGESIIACVRLGQSMYGASKSNGVSANLAWQWRQDGFRALAREANGEEVEGRFEPYMRFVHDLEKAEAEFETRSLARIEAAAQGGGIITTEREVVKVNAEGKVIERTTTTGKKQLEGQWTADAWRLERRFPERYARMVKNQHSLEEPDPVPKEDRIASIAEAASAYLDGVSDGKALPAVIDAESSDVNGQEAKP